MLGGNYWLLIILLVNVFILGIVIAFAVSHWHRHIRPKDKAAERELLPHEVRQQIYDQARSDYEKVLRRSAVAFGKDLDETTEDLTKQLDKLGEDIMEDEMARYKSGLELLQDETQKKLGTTSAEIESHQADLRKQFAERITAMDAQLAEHQREIETKLADRSVELERELAEIQANYTKRQSALEAELAEKESTLAATLKERESALATHQAELENDLVGRQKLFADKQSELEQRLDAEMTKRREAYTQMIDTSLNDAVIAFLSETLGQHVDLGAQVPHLIAELDAHKDELKRELGA
jgi:hypothetical protein